jgi:hypothetical protein
MQQLATEGIPLTLALSLNAPDHELRDELVPINTRWNVEEMIDAAWGYAKTTKRRVSIEYILIRDINDQPATLLWRKRGCAGHGAGYPRPGNRRGLRTTCRIPGVACSHRCRLILPGWPRD